MPEHFATQQVVVVNPNGMHARPASMFVKLAAQFESQIAVTKHAQRVDGKSILDILTLAADTGCHLTIEARGRDAAEAVETLVRFVANDGRLAARPELSSETPTS